MSSNNFIRRVPSRISGRSFSNGILLKGGNKQAVAVRLKNGKIDVEVSDIKNRNTSKSIPAFINMLVLAAGGILESFKVLKKNNRVVLFTLLESRLIIKQKQSRQCNTGIRIYK